MRSRLRADAIEQAEAAAIRLVTFIALDERPHSRIAKVVVGQIAGELSGQVRIGKIDIDDNPEAAAKYRVSSIPTMILFKDGKEAARTIGAQPKGALLDLINAHK